MQDKLPLGLDNVGLVSVTYNSSRLAEFMAETAQHFKNVWIVDNCSKDNPVKIFEANIPHAKVISLDRNLGFGAANNIGFRESLSASLGYTLFLNPDCQISPDMVLRVLQTLHSRAEAGIVCPRVFDEDGKAYDILRCDFRGPYNEKQVEHIDVEKKDDPIVRNGCLEGACLLGSVNNQENVFTFGI